MNLNAVFNQIFLTDMKYWIQSNEIYVVCHDWIIVFITLQILSSFCFKKKMSLKRVEFIINEFMSFASAN